MLKQSPRCWNTALDKQLKEMGFVQSTSDPCIYIDAGGDIFFIGVYVDDIILASRTLERVTEVKEALSQKFDIKDMGKLHFFLGMQVMQDMEILGWDNQHTRRIYLQSVVCKIRNRLVHQQTQVRNS